MIYSHICWLNPTICRLYLYICIIYIYIKIGTMFVGIKQLPDITTELAHVSHDLFLNIHYFPTWYIPIVSSISSFLMVKPLMFHNLCCLYFPFSVESQCSFHNIRTISYISLVGGLEHGFHFPYIGNVIIPTDEVHHFSEGWLNHQPVKPECRKKTRWTILVWKNAMENKNCDKTKKMR